MSANRPSRLVQLSAVVRKETLQTAGDRRLLAMLLVAPLAQLLVFGYAVNFKVDRIPTVLVDQDGTTASREHARRLLADGTLLLVGSGSEPAFADSALEDGTAAAALVLPAGFSRHVDRGETAEAQVLLDGTDPNRSTIAAATASRYFSLAATDLLRERLAQAGASPSRLGGLSLAPRIWYNPALDSPPFMVPGMLAMLLVVVTTIVTAMGLAREREMGTLEQVLVTPLRPAELLAGKMVPYVVMGFVDVGLALVVGAWVFEVPLRGSLGLVAAATLCYLLSTLGIGLLISTVSRSQQQAFLGGFLFAMPAILLSGVMTPIASMPAALQALTLLNPLRYYQELLRAILLKGAGLSELWPTLTALLGFGLGIFVVAALRFRKRIA